jgi:phosphinothricin acetyltransferase
MYPINRLDAWIGHLYVDGMSGVILRAATIEDAAGIAAVYAPYVANTVISFELAPPSASEMAERIGRVSAYAPWLLVETDAGVSGYAYLSPHHERAAYQWSADCAVYVASARRRSGLGRALYTTLFALGRLQGLCAVHAGITLPNAPSVGLHEAFGFVPVARYPKVGHKLGAWHDVGWWQLELDPREHDPPARRSPAEAARETPDAWAAAFEAGQRLLGGTETAALAASSHE